MKTTKKKAMSNEARQAWIEGRRTRRWDQRATQKARFVARGGKGLTAKQWAHKRRARKLAKVDRMRNRS